MPSASNFENEKASPYAMESGATVAAKGARMSNNRSLNYLPELNTLA